MKQSDIIISDMARCEPASVSSLRETCEQWQLLPYRTCDAEPQNGVMIGAPSYVEAPEATLPLNLSGWHAISVGFWIPKA